MGFRGTADLASVLDQHDAERVAVRQAVSDESAVTILEDVEPEIGGRKKERVKREDRYPVPLTPLPLSRESCASLSVLPSRRWRPRSLG